MKKLVLAAVVLASASANAEEIKFGDLNYFLKSNQYQFSADVNQSVTRNKIAGVAIEEEGVETTAALTYGLFDNLNVFVQLGYNLAFDTHNESSKETTSTSGLRNPALGATYRLVNPSNGGYVVDFGAKAAIRVQDAKEDNSASPRHSLDLFGRIGRKYNEANEMQLTAGVVHFFDGEAKDKGVKEDHDSSNDIYVRVAYQWRPVNEFMMATAIQGTRVGEYKIENTKLDAHTDFDIFFNAKYLVDTNMIVRFNYQFGRYSEFDLGASSVDMRRHQKFGLGVDYLF